MKLISIMLAKRTAAALAILIAAFILPVQGQQPLMSQPPDFNRTLTEMIASADDSGTDQKTDKQTKQPVSQPYVFPTHAERFKRFVNSTVGPFTLARTAISAGINQWRDHPEEWEQGASGYGKRFASSFGKHAIHQTVTYGLDEALGLDTGFKRSTRKGFGPRLKDALLENVTSRNREGDRVVSVPRFAGAYTSAIIRAETWYPSRYDYKNGLRSGTNSILTGFAFNALREFIRRK